MNKKHKQETPATAPAVRANTETLVRVGEFMTVGALIEALEPFSANCPIFARNQARPALYLAVAQCDEPAALTFDA